MTNIQAIVSSFKDQDLSGDEIFKLTGKYPVIFSDLGKYQNVTDLLGKENYVIILYQTSSYTTGHYISLSKNDTTGKVRYFDSYGIANPLREIQYTPFDQKLPNYLASLLAGVDYESNTFDYQASGKVSTCGRWSSLASLFHNFSLLEFHQLFKGNQGFLSNTDNCATILTLLVLEDIRKFLNA